MASRSVTGLQTMEHIGSGKEVGQWLGAHAFSFTTGSPSKRRKGRWTQRGTFRHLSSFTLSCSHPCAPPAAHHVRGLVISLPIFNTTPAVVIS